MSVEITVQHILFQNLEKMVFRYKKQEINKFYYIYLIEIIKNGFYVVYMFFNFRRIRFF